MGTRHQLHLRRRQRHHDRDYDSAASCFDGCRPQGQHDDDLTRQHRTPRLPTGLTVSNPADPPSPSSRPTTRMGAWSKETMPGGITATIPTTSPAKLTGASLRPGQRNRVMWLAWTQQRDVDGRVRREYTPQGSLSPTHRAVPVTRWLTTGQYSYEPPRASDPGRRPHRHHPTMALDPSNSAANRCLVPADYTFDHDGNRTGLVRTPGDAAGPCAHAP